MARRRKVTDVVEGRVTFFAQKTIIKRIYKLLICPKCGFEEFEYPKVRGETYFCYGCTKGFKKPKCIEVVEKK